MWELYYHMRRYLAWSAFGIVVFVTPILAVTGGQVRLGPLFIVIGFGGSVFVLIRAIIGAVTGWSPGRADRATAIVVRRFFVGWCMGFLVGFALYLVRRGPGSPREPPILGWMVAGGFSLVLSVWLIRLQRVWVVFPFVWLGALAVFMTLCLLFAR